MKRIISILLLFNSSLCFSQTDTIRWDYQKLDSIINTYKDGYHIFKKGNKMIKEGNYKNNCGFGIWKYYYNEGNIESLVEYICTGNGRSDENGKYIEFYKSGQIKSEGRYQKTKNDSVPCIQCYEKDQLKKIEWAEFSTSLKVGEWKEYFENGKIKSIGKYFAGLHQTFNTAWRKEDSNGMKIGIGTIGTDYLKDGEWKTYNDAGNLLKIEYYKEGTFIGDETFE